MSSLLTAPTYLPRDFVGVSGMREDKNDAVWQQDFRLYKYKGHPWSSRSKRDAFEADHLWATPGLQEMDHVEGRFLPLRLANGGWEVPEEPILQGLADQWRYCGMPYLIGCDVRGCRDCRRRFPIGGMTHYQVQCARSYRLSDGGPKAPTVVARFEDDPRRPGRYAIISCVQCSIDKKQNECTVKGYSFGPVADLDKVAFLDRPGIKRKASVAGLSPAGRPGAGSRGGGGRNGGTAQTGSQAHTQQQSYDGPADRDPSSSPLQQIQSNNDLWMLAMGRGDCQMERFTELAKNFFKHLD